MKITIKMGGDLLKGKALNVPLVEDLKRVVGEHSVVIVHGGGDEVTEMAKRLGKEQIFVMSPEGFKSRYTDRETADIYAMVMAGKINTMIVGTLQSFGINAIGLSGFDGGLLRAERKKRLVIVEGGKKRAIEGGYTGKITSVESGLLDTLMGRGFTPVISPLAMGTEYEPLNVDGDRTTGAVAKAVKADLMVFLTDVAGVLIGGKVVPKISAVDAGEAIEGIGPGMSTKIHAAIDAVRGGVGRAVIASGFTEKPLSDAIDGRGTVISL